MSNLAPVGGLLGLTALVTVFYQLVFFFIAYGLQFDKVTDLAGGSNFVILAAITYGLGAVPLGPSQQQMAITSLVIVWGVRLSGFLLYRILVINEDHRFDGIRDSFFKFLFFWVFQMLWVWVVSLPVTFINSLPTLSSKGMLQAGDYAGIVLAAAGLLIETAADQTKFDFKQVCVESDGCGACVCVCIVVGVCVCVSVWFDPLSLLPGYPPGPGKPRQVVQRACMGVVPPPQLLRRDPLLVRGRRRVVTHCCPLLSFSRA